MRGRTCKKQITEKQPLVSNYMRAMQQNCNIDLIEYCGCSEIILYAKINWPWSTISITTGSWISGHTCCHLKFELFIVKNCLENLMVATLQ